jgi:hypothetical protein
VNPLKDFFIRYIDPYKQTPFFFHWTTGKFLLLTTAILGFYHWKYIAFVKTLISNIFTYFPNYLIHEFAHRIVGSFLFQAAYRYSPCTTASVQDCYPIANWLTTLAGRCKLQLP